MGSGVQISMFGDDDREYREFVDKFKPKKTTDDCETPANVYDAVADWAALEYGVDRTRFLRPFWPGGDFERFPYPAGGVVVDNPPFSILARIMRFYQRRGIRFFLFAPTLTLFSGRGLDVTYIPVGVHLTYANGANVNTSFVTNLDDCRVRSAPDLYRAVRRANDVNEKARTKQLPRYRFPDHVLTAAAAYQYSHYGIPYRLEKADCVFVRGLDGMRGATGKTIFGGAMLLSERAAAERAAAERAAAERAAARVWELSEREWRMVKKLGNGDGEGAGTHAAAPEDAGGRGDFGGAIRGTAMDLQAIPGIQAGGTLGPGGDRGPEGDGQRRVAEAGPDGGGGGAAGG